MEIFPTQSSKKGEGKKRKTEEKKGEWNVLFLEQLSVNTAAARYMTTVELTSAPLASVEPPPWQAGGHVVPRQPWLLFKRVCVKQLEGSTAPTGGVGGGGRVNLGHGPSPQARKHLSMPEPLQGGRAAGSDSAPDTAGRESWAVGSRG